MIELFVDGVGIAAPGLSDWAQARPVLLGKTPYAEAALPAHAPGLLPANERRRATPSVRQAFRAAEDAISGCPEKAGRLAAVFASSEADLGVIQRICLALTEPACAVSPTDFHNSVHNAAAGYWSIATGSRLPSTTICAYDASFAAGLLEAALLIAAENHPTLLVCYDVPGPPLLQAQRRFECVASSALLLSGKPGPATLARLRLSLVEGPDTRLDDPALEALRLGNPALRALPLLRLLAQPEDSVRQATMSLPGRQALQIECAAR